MTMEAIQLALYFHPAYPAAEALPRAKQIVKQFSTARGRKLSPMKGSDELLKADRDASFESGVTRIYLDDWSEDHKKTQSVWIHHFDDKRW